MLQPQPDLFARAHQSTPANRGFFDTILEAGRRGIIEGTNESQESLGTIGRGVVGEPAFRDKQSPISAATGRPGVKADYVDQLLQQSPSQGWRNPDWWAAHVAYGSAKSYPSAALGLAGMAVGSEIAPGIGTAILGTIGFGLGSLIQTLAPAYQQARAEGLDHDAAVDRALKETGIAVAFGALAGGIPNAGLFGKTLEGALKRPVSELLAQIFGVQPGLSVIQGATTRAIEGKPITPDEIVSDYMDGLTSGAVRPGGHHVLRRFRGSIWWQLPFPRGRLAEQKLGINLHLNHKAIDFYDKKTSQVRSIKSVDLRSRGYRENPNGMFSKLRRDINNLADYEGDGTVPTGSVKSRILFIGVPRFSKTSGQSDALRRVIEYGQQRGVVVWIVGLR
jgi:hypothetical protein